VVLPEGITVHRFSIRLTLDEQTRNYLQQRRNHSYESAHTMRRMEVIRRSLAGENGLLVMHLDTHRDDTGSIIQMLANDRTTSENRRIELIRELIDKGFIQDADLDAFTRSLVQQSTLALGAPSGAPQLGALTSPAVVPGVVVPPAQVAATPPERTSAAPAPQPEPQSPPEPQPSTSDNEKQSGGVTTWKQVGRSQ
jgi:hypothetical protein